MRNGLIAIVVLIALGGAALLLIRLFAPRASDAPPPAAGEVRFEDVAAAAGINFRHFDPATPLHLMPETMGSGLGWIDYDGDGWPDLFCVQDGPLPPATDPSRTNKLYRNNRNGTFDDVTDRVGLNTSGFGMGCAVGDYDNDGFDDLVVTYLGGIGLYHNVADAAAPGGRRFEDVTAASKLTDPHWATSCAWGDLDGDGLLDLYVCNYVEVDPANPVTCPNHEKKVHVQCHPSRYPPAAHRLFRNIGRGVFADVSLDSGAAGAPGLGVAIVDLDADGRPDIYVANDMAPAYLFRNLGGMKFEEVAFRSGAAFGPSGGRIAGMGVEAFDADGCGRPALFVTNYQNAPNVLLRNRGNLRFDERSYGSGLGGPSLDRLAFGACVLDANLDGHADLAVANGHVQRVAQQVFGVPYAQSAQLFLGDGAGQFRDASDGAGADFVKPRVGRGLARADFDNDGLPDLAMSGVGEAAALLRNRAGNGRGWVGLELIGDGKASNSNAVGATVKVEWAGRVSHHFVVGGGSYLSASDRRLSVGLGDAGKLDRVTVRWPSGKVQEFRDLPARSRWRLREGAPAAEPFAPPAK